MHDRKLTNGFGEPILWMFEFDADEALHMEELDLRPGLFF